MRIFVTCTLVGMLFVIAGCSPKASDPWEYSRKHQINSPDDLTDEHCNKIFANLTQESRREVVEKLTMLAKLGGDDEWENLYYHTIQWVKDYPVVYDPAKKAEYWQAASQELCDYLGDRIEKYQDNDIKGDKFFFPHRMTDDQKTRLLADEPLYVNPNLGRFYDRYIYAVASWNHPDNPAQAFMFEARDKELAPLRISDTPELVALNLTVGDISRWDGSTSLQPVARIVAAHSAKIPWQWRPPGGYGHSKTSDIVFTDHYYWSFDDEAGNAIPEENYNRHLQRRDSYDNMASSSSPTVIPSDEASPNAKYLNIFKFSQTHQAYVNLIEGSRDLMFATRMPSKDEIALAKQKGVELEFHPFAKDAFIFIANRNNPVRDLTLDQARDIFSGKITKWNQVGGYNGMINPLIRDRNSGSEELMRELVMKNIVVPDKFKHQLISSMSGIFDHLEKNIEGIGYSILYYDHYMVRSPYTRTVRINGIEPTPETVVDGSYPLLYECVAVVRKDSPDRAKAVARWLTSEEGASVIRESGYVPVEQ